MQDRAEKRIFGVVGWKNSGKTGLVERLVAELTGRGYAVSTLKHAHHAFDLDRPGKDSYRHRAAGAREVLLTSDQRWALMHELGDAPEPRLEEHIARLAPCDLLIVEGWKREDYPKIEANRAETGQPLLAREDPAIVAVASDQAHPELDLPLFDLDDTAAIADFLLDRLGLARRAENPARGTGGGEESGPGAAADDAGKAEAGTLSSDCFALPQGVSWMPVEQALARLRVAIVPHDRGETLPLAQAAGRVLAAPVRAPRANPPADNSAVDGYAIGLAALAGEAAPLRLKLAEGRAAAGAPWGESLPPGQALRILTGALIPEGADTVVMQEDVQIEGGDLILPGLPRMGANLRRAGEDLRADQIALDAGRRLGPTEIALLAGIGQDKVPVRPLLRVGVLSTGDEIIPADGGGAPPDRIYDANRPMLIEMLRGWGHEVRDLGHRPDDRATLRAAFDEAAQGCDALIVSGGASAGDEDHVSALLREEGQLTAWRVAMKPGRPLALARWCGTPVFGLPGNPVAAFVSAAIFARPALALLSGAPWPEPRALLLPAAFEKDKKPGRREYLRARLNASGEVEVFRSEGSGLLSGLAWARGLAELPEEAAQITPGTLVRYLPFSSLGIASDGGL